MLSYTFLALGLFGTLLLVLSGLLGIVGKPTMSGLGEISATLFTILFFVGAGVTRYFAKNG